MHRQRLDLVATARWITPRSLKQCTHDTGSSCHGYRPEDGIGPTVHFQSMRPFHSISYFIVRLPTLPSLGESLSMQRTRPKTRQYQCISDPIEARNSVQTDSRLRLSIDTFVIPGRTRIPSSATPQGAMPEDTPLVNAEHLLRLSEEPCAGISPTQHQRKSSLRRYALVFCTTSHSDTPRSRIPLTPGYCPESRTCLSRSNYR